jgi:peptidoglycan/LPS O-acetylase OafA/YrhL
MAARSTGRLDALTGLRFLMAFGVFLGHLALFFVDPTASPTSRSLSAVLSLLGLLRMSLFFLLSGFVLTWSARSGDTAPAFWRRRFVRIYPNHVVVWIVLVSFLVLTGTSAFPGSGQTVRLVPSLANLALVNSWVPDVRYVVAGNPVAWTLSAEVFFYLLFPLLLPVALRLTGRRLWVAVGGTVLALWTVPAISLSMTGVKPANLAPLTLGWWFAYMFPLSRLPEFVLGMLVARLLAEDRGPRIGAVASVLLTVAVMGVSIAVLPLAFSYSAAPAVPLAILLLALARAAVQGRKSVLGTRVMVFLGERSYAFFLVHFTVIAMVFLAVGGHRQGAAATAALAVLCTAVTLLASCLLYTFVERPCMRRFARAARTRPVPVSSFGTAA